MEGLDKHIDEIHENCKKIHQLFIERELVPNETYLNIITSLSKALSVLEDQAEEEIKATIKERLLKFFEETKALNGMVAILTISWDTSASVWNYDSSGIECKCFSQTFAFIQTISWSYDKISCLLGDAGLIDLLVTSLHAYNPSHFNGETSEVEEEIVMMTVSTGQNMSYCEMGRVNFVDSGYVEALIPYLKTPKVYFKTSVIMCLAYLVNENQSEIFKEDPSHLRYIILLLETSLKAEDRTAKGWTPFRLVRGLSSLASNDTNKRDVLDAGILPSLVTMMNNGTNQEKKVAAHTIWVLSYDSVNKEKMGANQDVMDALMGIVKHTSDHEVKQMAFGALLGCGRYKMTDFKNKKVVPFNMHHSGRDESSIGGTSPKKISPSPRPRSSLTKSKPLPPIAPSPSPSSNAPAPPPLPASGPPPQSPALTPSPGTSKGHIMISYSWSNQKQVLEISEYIKKAGYKVWLDVDEIEGSTLEAMANGVENAHVVLVCMSQSYKDSPNTRAEAEYAFQLQKEIVPLKLQRNYKPDGWLGFIVGSKLFFDFSGKYTFESRIDGLLKELRRKYFPDSEHEESRAVVAVVEANKRPNEESGSNSRNKILTWTSQDVKQWLDGLRLSRFDRSVTEGWTGLNLLYLKRIENKAPEFFYHYMATTLKLSLDDMMRLEDGLFIL